MGKIDTTTRDLRELRSDELYAVSGAALGVRPLGTEQLFWDPLWWQVGATGHLPTAEELIRLPR
jgi:hypothetical protein